MTVVFASKSNKSYSRRKSLSYPPPTHRTVTNKVISLHHKISIRLVTYKIIVQPINVLYNKYDRLGTSNTQDKNKNSFSQKFNELKSLPSEIIAANASSLSTSFVPNPLIYVLGLRYKCQV